MSDSKVDLRARYDLDENVHIKTMWEMKRYILYNYTRKRSMFSCDLREFILPQT